MVDKDLFETMEQRYGPAFTQGIRDKLVRCETREIQYLEMKQMAEILFRFRERARSLVNLYRSWRQNHECQDDEVEKLYGGYDGMFLRRQLEDAWRLYMMANRDYHEMYRQYMAQLDARRKRYAPRHSVRAHGHGHHGHGHDPQPRPHHRRQPQLDSSSQGGSSQAGSSSLPSSPPPSSPPHNGKNRKAA